MSLCPESDKRSTMTDAEFWEHVFGRTQEDYEAWSVAFDPDTFAIGCVQCGRTVEVDPETAHERERDAFCDDCASEHLPDGEDHLESEP